MTEHNLKIYLDEPADMIIGDRAELTIYHNDESAVVSIVITEITKLRNSDAVIYSFEILDYMENEGEYLQVVYDRVPSLPQTLTRDYGIVTHLLRNIAHRLIR